MREKAIEQKLTLMVKKQGGICPKFVSPGFDGMPDRIVLLPGGCMAFVEVKAPGKKTTGITDLPPRTFAKVGVQGLRPG